MCWQGTDAAAAGFISCSSVDDYCHLRKPGETKLLSLMDATIPRIVAIYRFATKREQKGEAIFSRNEYLQHPAPRQGTSLYIRKTGEWPAALGIKPSSTHIGAVALTTQPLLRFCQISLCVTVRNSMDERGPPQILLNLFSLANNLKRREKQAQRGNTVKEHSVFVFCPRFFALLQVIRKMD